MKKNIFIYHLFFWIGLYLLWVLIFRTYSVALSKTMTIEFCYLIFITVDYYAINNYILPRFLYKKKYVTFVFVTLILILLSAWIRSLVAMQITIYYFHTSPINGIQEVFFNSLMNILIWVLMITTGKMLMEWIQNQQRLELLEKERVKNELDYLKAQINPHALFNSLNTIYGYIDKSNQVARNILLQFSEQLRYQLYECNAEKVSLEKEMNYIENYISFQRLRKDGNLVVDVQIENIEEELRVVPLLLVVLIENSFKFVSDFSDQENKISIDIFTKEKILFCSFSNTKEAFPNNSDSNCSGIGLANLKRRLELLYANKYQLTICNEQNIYRTDLTIDLS